MEFPCVALVIGRSDEDLPLRYRVFTQAAWLLNFCFVYDDNLGIEDPLSCANRSLMIVPGALHRDRIQGPYCRDDLYAYVERNTILFDLYNLVFDELEKVAAFRLRDFFSETRSALLKSIRVLIEKYRKNMLSSGKRS